MTDYLLADGTRMAGDDPTLAHIAGASALPEGVDATRDPGLVAVALASPPALPGAPCVVVYASGSARRDDRAVRAVPVRVPPWRAWLRSHWQRATDPADWE